MFCHGIPFPALFLRLCCQEALDQTYTVLDCLFFKGRVILRRTVIRLIPFVTASLLFCIGAMTFVGCINAGLRQDYELLFTKSLLDCISSCMLSVTLGIGVLCSAGFVLVFQGAIVLLAQVLAPVLSDAAIAELTCCGSVMIVAISLNMLGLTKIKTADLLPALLFVPLFTWLFSYLPL